MDKHITALGQPTTSHIENASAIHLKLKPMFHCPLPSQYRRFRDHKAAHVG